MGAWMNYKSIDNRIILTDCDSFDIAQTLECGQIFRFTRLAERDYIIVAFSKMLRIRQDEEITELSPCTPDEFENIWTDYFDLRRDYSAIKKTLAADPVMARAIGFAGGIRILNQEPWECLLSFIISQNMNIPRIKKLVGTLSERYGDHMDGYCSFPRAEQLLPAGVDGLIDCRTGFRAKYLFGAIKKVVAGELDMSRLAALPTAELRDELKSISGVGDKIADCVLLFAFGRHEVFPMDVWVKRAMRQLYFDDREVRPSDAYLFAQERFGAYAGVAQQYLFHYMRNNTIRKKEE
jgi:N-glycosylase/DNA lyase